MQNIVPLNFIFSDETIKDGLVNITALASAYQRATISPEKPKGVRKDPRNWFTTKEAQDSIAYLERATGIPVASLVIVENGVGTWVHADLAEIFAQWISVEYRFAVVALIRQAKSPQVVQPTLPFAEELLEEVKCINEIQNALDNPRLVQFYIDLIVDRRASQESTVFAVLEYPIKGAAEIAEDLVLPVNSKNRSQLGKFMAKQGHEILKEKRLCSGQMREINCYRQTPEVEESIRLFFS